MGVKEGHSRQSHSRCGTVRLGFSGASWEEGSRREGLTGAVLGSEARDTGTNHKGSFMHSVCLTSDQVISLVSWGERPGKALVPNNTST